MSATSCFGDWCTAAGRSHYYLPGLPLPLCGRVLARGELTPPVKQPGSEHPAGGKLVLPRCEACKAANQRRWERGGAL